LSHNKKLGQTFSSSFTAHKKKRTCEKIKRAEIQKGPGKIQEHHHQVAAIVFPATTETREQRGGYTRRVGDSEETKKKIVMVGWQV
jgi:hypothetical protein